VLHIVWAMPERSTMNSAAPRGEDSDDGPHDPDRPAAHPTRHDAGDEQAHSEAKRITQCHNCERGANQAHDERRHSALVHCLLVRHDCAHGSVKIT
jgi:hypothetical protein